MNKQSELEMKIKRAEERVLLLLAKAKLVKAQLKDFEEELILKDFEKELSTINLNAISNKIGGL